MITKEVIDRGLDLFEKHVVEYDNLFRRRNKLPKNYDWRPYCWCSRDIVFNLTVVRHNRQGNYLEVDVCLIANPPQYIENSGARVALGFLFSEAYRCGGSMEIAFTKNVEGGRVPAYICDLAIEADIKLKHVFEGRITPFESRQLYMYLAGFSEAAQNHIIHLASKKQISPERACFMVMGGVWSLAEAESIILCSPHPDRILASLSDPSDRHLYLNDLVLSKNAILGGLLDRKMLKAELVENGLAIESEDIEAPVSVQFDSTHFAKIYRAEVDTIIPWLNQEKILAAGQQLVVLVRARSDNEIRRYFLNDLESLRYLSKAYRDEQIETIVCLLTPRDFEFLPESLQQQIVEILEDSGVYLMISPETTSQLSREAIRRLETGKVVRQ